MNSNAPKISIITPSFNQGQYIGQTINSIIDQQYPNIDYKIYDGGSNDNTISVIKAYEEKINYWISEKDNGQSEAINKGFKNATGTIINWLNSDDYYENGTLQHVATQFNDPSVNCYAGISHIFGGVREYFSAGTDIYPGNLAKTIGWARIDQPETFFRKVVIDDVGYLNEGLHFVMDKDFWIRYLCKYGLSGIKKDKKLLVHFRHHADSKTVSLIEKFDFETLNLFYTYAHYLKLQDICKKFESLGQVHALPLQFWPRGLPVKEWEAVFNYFFLHKGLSAYAVNDYTKAVKALRCVDSMLLAPEDRGQMAKVMNRMKYLPVVLKKLINRFS